MKRVSIVPIAVAIVFAIVGCTSIPSSGPVREGGVIDDDLDVSVGYIPSGPRPGSTQTVILQDFMQAATSPQDNYETARQFLAKSVRELWKPDAEVSIRSGAALTETVGDRIAYSFSTTATIDETGRYAEDTEVVPRELEFGFVQEDGEWRISDLDDGIVLTDDNFDIVFAARPLYFFDPSYAYLVPDLRWFPVTNLTTTRIATALIAGPPDWLHSAVVTAFPVGTTPDVVTVESGVATIDLSEEAAAAAPPDRNRMLQQLKASLTSVSTVSSVVVSVGGVELPVSDSSAEQAIVQPSVNSLPLVVQEGVVGFATTTQIAPLDALGPVIGGMGVLGGSYSATAQRAAVRTSDGVFVVAQGAEPLRVDARPGLIDPSVDNYGFTWSASAGDAQSIEAFAPDGTAQSLVVSSLPVDARLVALEVSRDGARLLIYLTTDAGPYLAVAGIVRGDEGPTQLTEPVELPVVRADPIDAAWVDDRSVVALTGGSTQARAIAYEIGGPSTDLGVLDAAVGIVSVGNGGTDNLVAITTDGSIFKPRSTTWQNTGIDASSLLGQQPG
jgi:hypothetical protein